jgi:hypothetical protein
MTSTGGLMSFVADRVRATLTDPYSGKSLGSRLRARRWQMFATQFPDVGTLRVLDLGGTAENWRTSPVRPAEVVMVNLMDQPCDEPWLHAVRGDACAPPAEVTAQDFDLVYSNSVLEHVGGHQRRQQMADVVNASAPRHWVQTPYRYFPIEPHWLFPGFQFLPVSTRVRASERWPFGWSRPTGREAVQNVLDVELVSFTEMRYYFPQSRVVAERFAGLPKSLIAIRR